MYKYSLEQTVWYLIENETYSAPVLTRANIENAHEDMIANTTQEKIFAALGRNGNYYVTIHCVIKEELLFESKEDLLLHYSGFDKIFVD